MFNMRNLALVASAIAAVFVVAMAGELVEHLDAQEIMVIQSVNGNLTVYDTPGYHPQWFGKVTKYARRASYDFEAPIRFNDGAQAKMHGSIQFEIPTDAHEPWFRRPGPLAVVVGIAVLILNVIFW